MSRRILFVLVLICAQGVIRCMTFSNDGKYVLSSALGERYVDVWEVAGSKKKSACCVLAMDCLAIFIDSRYICVGNAALSVLSISEMGICYLWSGKDIEELRQFQFHKSHGICGGLRL